MPVIDNELGQLIWNPDLDWWEGTIRLSSPEPFFLYVLSRFSPEHTITDNARAVVARLRILEPVCRVFAAHELLDVHNREWAEGKEIEPEEFARRLVPDSIEVHESGYAEVHFGDGGLFWGHGVGVRIRDDGSFQEAVVEG